MKSLCAVSAGVLRFLFSLLALHGMKLTGLRTLALFGSLQISSGISSGQSSLEPGDDSLEVAVESASGKQRHPFHYDGSSTGLGFVLAGSSSSS